MNELIEKLLSPVSAEQPCGPDLSDKAQFDELERISKGRPEVEVGSVKKPAEPPDWRELKAKSAEYLASSKHLRVAVHFCCASLQTGGLAGFRDGLQLLRGLAEQYWPTLHPLLDPTDNNDPTQRLNILSALNSPRGTLMPGMQQWLAIIDYLHTTPLCQPKGAEAITLQMIAGGRPDSGSKPAESEAGVAPAVVGFDSAQIARALRAAPPAEIEANHTAVSEALEALTSLDQFLTQTLGVGASISFEELHNLLIEIQGLLKSYLPSVATEPGGAGEAGGDAAAIGGSGVGFSISGAVRSREDVVRTLDAICGFYDQVEPSSPVPYLLRRAQKLAMMNFVEVVQELNIATVDALKPSMGSAVESAPPQGESPPPQG